MRDSCVEEVLSCFVGIRRCDEGCRAVVAIGLLLLSTTASAGVTQQGLAAVEARPAPDARLPLAVTLQNGKGESREVQAWLEGHVSIWIVADFTCQTLCSPVLRTTADHLIESGLEAGRDFNEHRAD